MEPSPVLFLDLDGTLVRKHYHLDRGHVAPSAWQAIAEALGPEALQEEEETQARWGRGEYNGYVEWMEDTIRIHQKYGLTSGQFRAVVDSAEIIPGAAELVRNAHDRGFRTAIVSGGIKAIADRVQVQLGIHHALTACEYFFDSSGSLIHWNLLPCDYAGKVDFMELIIAEHGTTASRCVFVGDGKNDAPLAKAVGTSVAFNPQPELRDVSTHVIEQDQGAENLGAVITVLDSLS